MRIKFIKSLIQMAEENEKVILIVGDLGYSVVEPFQKNFQIDLLMLVFVNKT